MNHLFKLFVFFLAQLCTTIAFCQFAPQVPLEGNTAIHKNDQRFQCWADHAIVHKGLIDIADSALGFASYGTSSAAVGPAENLVVSLGDNGTAILTFPKPIYNGDGPDFAVFENGFSHPTDSLLAFLELAFVEVSSDGENYVRFPAVSLYHDSAQLDNFSYMDARKINNLAGKYISNYGTPFDLEELKDSTGIDINNITHIKIIDVIGTKNPTFGTTDHNSNIINDPYPSHFNSSGFDLDGVGVIHCKIPANITLFPTQQEIIIYPNPATDYLMITPTSDNIDYTIFDILGKKILEKQSMLDYKIDIRNLNSGIYFLKINEQTIKFVKK